MGKDGDLVFCRQCKHYKRFRTYGGGILEECHVDVYYIYKYSGYNKLVEDPSKKNIKNNCIDFKPLWYYRLLPILLKKRIIIKTEIR